MAIFQTTSPNPLLGHVQTDHGKYGQGKKKQEPALNVISLNWIQITFGH